VRADSLIGSLGQSAAAGGIVVDRLLECRDAVVVHVGSGDGRRGQIRWNSRLATRFLLRKFQGKITLKQNNKSTYLGLFRSAQWRREVIQTMPEGGDTPGPIGARPVARLLLSRESTHGDTIWSDFDQKGVEWRS
jgi:hypothetical protein